MLPSTIEEFISVYLLRNPYSQTHTTTDVTVVYDSPWQNVLASLVTAYLWIYCSVLYYTVVSFSHNGPACIYGWFWVDLYRRTTQNEEKTDFRWVVYLTVQCPPLDCFRPVTWALSVGPDQPVNSSKSGWFALYDTIHHCRLWDL